MKHEELNNFCQNTMISWLGMEFIPGPEDGILIRMPVSERTAQPHGFLHGGATIALAETLASVCSANAAGKDRGAFGYHVDASLLRPVRKGYVYGSAALAHRGRSSYIWDVTVTDESAETVALCRVTVKTVPGSDGGPVNR